jgi:hypothetical protein
MLPRMRFRLAGFAFLLLLPPAAEAGDAPSHLDLRRQGEAAYHRRDYVEARRAILAAWQLRPDSPRYLQNLAALSALTGDPDAALQYLNRAAALGVSLPIERDPDFAPLQGTPAFLRVLQRFAENRQPRGEAEVLAELPGRTGIIEGIAYHNRTGDVYFSDVHHRCIWRRDRSGRITRFSAEDEDLFGIFGIALDERRNSLWAATAAVPEMSGYQPEMSGLAALVEFDLGTSEIRRVVPVPDDGRDHGLGDLLVTPEGAVYATDSKAPVIWQLLPGEEEMDPLVDSPVFASLQGLVLFDRTLIVADYSNGLFAVQVPEGTVRALVPPPDVTLLGLDGLAAIPGGVIAVQNGITPERVVRIMFSPDHQSITSFEVLASALPHMTDLALITLVNDLPTVIAGAGWEGFDPAERSEPPPHTVRLLQVALP